jgi:hypothetical protein
MSFIIILKNTILMLLIVLILHVMITNEMINYSLEDRCTIKKTNDTIIQKTIMQDTFIQDTIIPDTIIPDTIIPDTVIPDIDRNFKELYDFVYEEGHVDTSLEKMFSTTIETPIIADSSEVKLHHSMVRENSVLTSNNMDSLLCDYSVVGDMNVDNENYITGFDTTCVHTYSKTI